VDFTASTQCFPVQITTQPPANYTVDEGDQVTLSVVASGTSPSYQWQRNTANIPGANSATYIIPAALPANGGSYRCVVTNNCPSSETSTACNLTVRADTIPPHVLSAIARANQGATMNTVVLTVDEALKPSGATNAANYTISGGAAPTVTSAVLSTPTNVVLTLSGGLTFGTLYNLNMNTLITDNAVNPNRVSPNSTNILQQSVVLTYSNAWAYDENQVATNDATGAIADGYWTNTPAFYAAGFTPVGWSNGPGILALETSQGVIDISPAPFLTTLTQPTHTIFFRTTVSYTGPTANVGFVANHFIDDGLMCYLNGSESFRFKMPTNALITYTNQASAGGEAVRASTNLTTGLVSGNNLIACSLHTQGTGSSDAVFGLEILAQFPLAVAARPELTIRRVSATEYSVSWSPALGILQETTAMSPTPVWVDSPVQSNPQTNTYTGARKFYGVRP